MKIVVAGGTGWIGSHLCRAMHSAGQDVVILTRGPARSAEPRGIRRVRWDGRAVGEWASEIEDADAVINLAGQSVMSGRWSEGRKRALLTSRTEPTAAIVGAMQRAGKRPAVLVNASA